MFTKINTPPGLAAIQLTSLFRGLPRDQTDPFLQNKPNFKKVKMHLTRYDKSTYDVWTLGVMGQNKPKQTQSAPAADAIPAKDKQPSPAASLPGRLCTRRYQRCPENLSAPPSFAAFFCLHPNTARACRSPTTPALAGPNTPTATNRPKNHGYTPAGALTPATSRNYAWFMGTRPSKPHKPARPTVIRKLYAVLLGRAYTALIFAALFCTLAAKFYHACRNNLVGHYLLWIAPDIAVLLAIELVLATVCYLWPKKWTVRAAVLAAAIVCTWSVMNAGILIRRGVQILPASVLPLLTEPLDSLRIVAVNILKMPAAAAALLCPSAALVCFLCFVLARPRPLRYSKKHFISKLSFSLITIFSTLIAHTATAGWDSAEPISQEMSDNCQLRAVRTLLPSAYQAVTTSDTGASHRKIPAFDEIEIASPSPPPTTNVVLVILEGVQYGCTSLADPQSNLTPHLAAVAAQGANFTSARSVLTHSTKAMFALLTGRYPSVSQDIIEAVPRPQPWASLASILRHNCRYRTAFFLSGQGSFEAAPGLMHNLGYEKFWARENLPDTDAYIGYMAADEFAMLPAVTQWLDAGDAPFLLTLMCSVTHDPYQVPKWFAEPAADLRQRYRQTIRYTDTFLAALDAELKKRGLADDTILCIISDHGEGFGEHGLFAHARIPFEEGVHIPWVIRAPKLVKPQTTITAAVGSIDLTPTVLSLLGFDIAAAGFDGVNALAAVPADRKVFFSGWMPQGPAGFVKNQLKFIYNPVSGKVVTYDLRTDPYERRPRELTGPVANDLATEIIRWQKSTRLAPPQLRKGKDSFYGHWLCRWNSRLAWAKYQKPAD